MKLVAALVLLSCVAVFAVDNEYTLFTKFIAEHNKQYKTTAEWDTRFSNFKNNLRRIEQLNAEANGVAVHGISKFADMTVEEFSQYPCGGNLLNRMPKANLPEVQRAPSMVNPSALPDSFDWTTKGAVTPVKDQGQCGSCWAFSSIGNIEGAWYLANKKLVSLSESELVDCSTTSYGCSGGWPFWAMSDILKSPINGRVDTEAGYPYKAQNAKCAFDANTVGATIKNYTSYCHEGTAACTETQIQTLLMKDGPLSVCLNAGAMMLYHSGVSAPTSCAPTAIDHCIVLVGWGVDSATNTKYWKLKNSWGTTWGEQGYYRLIRGVEKDQPAGRCGINSVITAAQV